MHQTQNWHTKIKVMRATSTRAINKAIVELRAESKRLWSLYEAETDALVKHRTQQKFCALDKAINMLETAKGV